MNSLKHSNCEYFVQKSTPDEKIAVRLQPNKYGGSGLNVPISVGATLVDNTCGGGEVSVVGCRGVVGRGRLLALLPRHINKSWSLDKFSGHELLYWQFERLLLFLKAKRRSKKRFEILDTVLANLLDALNHGYQLLYSRSHRDYDYRNMIEVTDYLESEGLIVNIIGKNNEYQGNSSFMIPTEKLRAEFEKAKVRVSLKDDKSLVELRDKFKKAKPLHRIYSKNVLKLKEISNTVQDYNLLWLKHEATINNNPVIPFCKRVFNISNALDLGGRWYSPFQNMLKSMRELILIDGERTVEPDFKAMHYCILYAKVGIQLDPIKDDPYKIEGFTRETAKLASLVLLNSDDLSRFKSNITKSGNPKVKKIFEDYKIDYSQFTESLNQGLPCNEPIKPKCLDGFIEGMPDGIQGETLLEAITAKHKAIKHFFGVPNIGLMLQNEDSNIMAKTIAQLSAINIPVLPVHDSLRCRESDSEKVMDAMNRAYKAVTGFDGCVTL